MKKILLGLFLVFLPNSVYSLEQIISIGGGIQYSRAELNRSYYYEYKNTDLNANKSCSTIFRYFDTNTSSSLDGNNINIEYQVRLNVLSLGVGYSYSKTNISMRYDGVETSGNSYLAGNEWKPCSSDSSFGGNAEISYISNNPYFLITFTAYENRYLALRLGSTLGVDIVRAGGNNYTNLNASLLADGEINITKKFLIFSRASLVGVKKNVVVSYPELQIDSSYLDTKIHYNQLKITPMKDLLKLNFGIRYKL
ncbi:MAG: hypothetical protein LBH40_00725 [Alphaproteobacteria bacterium]|jgi:hypothetical protein|nr:hypothetical protein [Alphaproteobacteria bacterium]